RRARRQEQQRRQPHADVRLRLFLDRHAAVVAVLGNIWSVLSPWKAAADGAGRLTRREGPPFEYPSRLGRWPAALLLLAFAAIELTYTNPSDPRALALAIAIYSAITWFGAFLFGSEAWFR